MCDNQRTGADMLCGNLNMKLWDLKRTGDVKSNLDFGGRNKNNEIYIYIPVKSDMFSFFNFCFKYLVKIKNKFSIKNLMSFHGY